MRFTVLQRRGKVQHQNSPKPKVGKAFGSFRSQNAQRDGCENAVIAFIAADPIAAAAAAAVVDRGVGMTIGSRYLSLLQR